MNFLTVLPYTLDMRASDGDISASENQNEAISQEQLDAMAKLHKRFLDGRLGGLRAVLRNKNLGGLNLRGQDMRQADFSGCNMQYMDLSGTDFTEANLYACDLSFSNLNDTVFARADCRGTQIEGANLEGADLVSADLREGMFAHAENYGQSKVVSFKGANLEGARLSGALINSADFSDANLASSSMINADLRNADFTGANLSHADIKGAQMEGACLRQTILVGVQNEILQKAGLNLHDALTDENIGHKLKEKKESLQQLLSQHALWIESVGEKGKRLDISNYDLRELESLKGQVLTAIIAQNTKFIGINFYRCEIQSAVLDGSDFRQCDLEETDFRGSSLIGANLCHANLRYANFLPLLFGHKTVSNKFAPCDLSGAQMRYADLQGAQLKNVSFRNADLSYANLAKCNLTDADFSNAQIKNTNFDGANIDQACFDGAKSGKLFSIGSLKSNQSRDNQSQDCQTRAGDGGTEKHTTSQ